jgi:hypothetical protein
MRPGAPGTKRFVQRYGEKLVSVRYVYDAERRKRYTTVELIVEAVAWDPYRWRLDPETEVPIRTEWGPGAAKVDVDVREGSRAPAGREDHARPNGPRAAEPQEKASIALYTGFY